MEHVSVGGDAQYHIPAIEAGGWDIFSSRPEKEITEAMELYRLAKNALGVRGQKFVGASKREWIAAAGGHRFPVTGTG